LVLEASTIVRPAPVPTSIVEPSAKAPRESSEPTRWSRYGLGSLVFVLALVFAFWNLNRPALWLDEAASAVATQRSWSDLWRLWGGTDAPLMPYYLVLKALSTASDFLVPSTAAHPEVLLRWPSALAVAAAAGLLVSWLRSALPAYAALTCGAVLMMLEAFSRYGQEARPYALILLLSVASTAAWWRLMRTRSIGSAIAYALCVAVLSSMHALAAMLVLAHGVASLLISRRTEKARAMVLFVVGALAGLLLAGPAVIAAVSNGGGATGYDSLSGPTLFTMFAALFGGGPQFLVMAALAAIGTSRWRHPRDADITRVAVCWALVPWLPYIPAVLARPNLLLGRYLIFTLPGWAILAGLGLVALSELTYRARTAFLGLALGLLLAFQWPGLVAVRGPEGHGRDVRATAAQLRGPALRDLPLVTPYTTDLMQLAAYAPRATDRIDNLRMSSLNIWPDRLDRPTAIKNLAGAHSVLLVVRPGTCGPMPFLLNGFRVTSQSSTGPLNVLVLSRPGGMLPPRGFRHQTPGFPPRLVLPCPAS
jgi:mannosyltransferase